MIVKIYFDWVFVLVFHELIHMLFLYLFKINIIEIRIGNIFFVRLKKIFISPLIINCSVAFDNIDHLSLLKKILIMLTPALLNILLGLMISDKYILFKIFNIFIGVSSLLPLSYLETDGYIISRELYTIIKKNK